MSKIILQKLQEINSLIWVLDIDKAKLILKEVNKILKEDHDPFYSKIVNKYKEICNNLYSQISQPQLDPGEDMEYGHYAHTDQFTSSLLIIKNKFELEARVVMTVPINLNRGKETIESSYESMEAHAHKTEESETALVYSITLSGEKPQFGEITFTHSGIAVGRIYSSLFHNMDHQTVTRYAELSIVITRVAHEIYRTNAVDMPNPERSE